MSATEVLEKVQLVCNMELLAISSMSEIGSEHEVCFGAFLTLKLRGGGGGNGPTFKRFGYGSHQLVYLPG